MWTWTQARQPVPAESVPAAQVISELDAGLNAMDASAHASSTDEEAAALREKLARRCAQH